MTYRADVHGVPRPTRTVRRVGAPIVSLAAVALLAACGEGGTEQAAPSSPGTPASSSAGPSRAPSATPSADPTPSATTGPTAAPSPSAPPVPTPSAWGAVEIRGGHEPGWFEGTGWSCGMPARLLDQGLDPATQLNVAGELSATSPSGEPAHDGESYLPVEIVSTGKPSTHMSPVAAVVTRDGIVVSLPPLADAEPAPVAGTAAAVVATRNFCLPGGESGGMATYEQRLPDGAYEVRGFVEMDPGATPRRLVLTDPVAAELKDGTWVAAGA